MNPLPNRLFHANALKRKWNFLEVQKKKEKTKKWERKLKKKIEKKKWNVENKEKEKKLMKDEDS